MSVVDDPGTALEMMKLEGGPLEGREVRTLHGVRLTVPFAPVEPHCYTYSLLGESWFGPLDRTSAAFAGGSFVEASYGRHGQYLGARCACGAPL